MRNVSVEAMLPASGGRGARGIAARTSSGGGADPGGPIRSGQVRAAGRTAAQLDPVRGTRASSARPARDRCRTSRRGQDASDRTSVAARSRSREQRLQDPVGRQHHREGAGARTAARECRRGRAEAWPIRAPGRRRRATAARGAAEHRRRAIDADQIDARPGQRQRDPARAASELEHRPARPARRAARTARRGGRASARSPSRRTARTRPIPANPLARRSCRWTLR